MQSKGDQKVVSLLDRLLPKDNTELKFVRIEESLRALAKTLNQEDQAVRDAVLDSLGDMNSIRDDLALLDREIERLTREAKCQAISFEGHDPERVFHCMSLVRMVVDAGVGLDRYINETISETKSTGNVLHLKAWCSFGYMVPSDRLEEIVKVIIEFEQPQSFFERLKLLQDGFETYQKRFAEYENALNEVSQTFSKSMGGLKKWL